MNFAENNTGGVDRFLRECALLPSQLGNTELNSIRSALLIEDVFDVVLTDEELGIDFLNNPEALQQLLTQKSTPL